MTYRFKLNLPRLILAIALMVFGVLSIITLTHTELILSAVKFHFHSNHSRRNYFLCRGGHHHHDV